MFGTEAGIRPAEGACLPKSGDQKDVTRSAAACLNVL
jgi:hypothetical protein